MRKLLQLKTLILLICVSFATTASAYDFYVNGIYYNQYTLSSVEVTYKNTAYNSYSGYISIPSSINVNGKTYAVCSTNYQNSSHISTRFLRSPNCCIISAMAILSRRRRRAELSR